VTLTLAELAERIGAEVVGDSTVRVSGAATLEEAQATHVSFMANPKYEKQLVTTRAGAVVVARAVVCERLNLLKAADPYLAFQKAVVALHGHRVHPHRGVHGQAIVDPTASVAEGTILYPGVYVGPRVKIGRDCILYPNIVIYDDCVIGDRVIIHAGASIGPDGFGFATSHGVHHKIPQVGNVVIEDDVEIGSNCSIARAAMGSTVVGKGTKIDALVAIGHGAKIGPHGLLVAHVGIAGSTVIGHHATFAGQAGVVGHLEIGDNVTVAAQSGVTHNVPDQSVVFGTPALPLHQGRRVYAILAKLPELLERIRHLEHQVTELAEEKRK